MSRYRWCRRFRTRIPPAHVRRLHQPRDTGHWKAARTLTDPRRDLGVTEEHQLTTVIEEVVRHAFEGERADPLSLTSRLPPRRLRSSGTREARIGRDTNLLRSPPSLVSPVLFGGVCNRDAGASCRGRPTPLTISGTHGVSPTPRGRCNNRTDRNVLAGGSRWMRRCTSDSPPKQPAASAGVSMRFLSALL